MEQSLEVGVPSKVKHPKTGDLLYCYGMKFELVDYFRQLARFLVLQSF